MGEKGSRDRSDNNYGDPVENLYSLLQTSLSRVI